MRILRWLFLGFLLVPLLEIFLFIKVGGAIGPIPTIGLVVLTAVVGAVLMRHQGLASLTRARSAMNRGEVPALEMLEGVVILFCGALLLTPGFFTDAIGFLGLVPAVRRALVLQVVGRVVMPAYPRRGPSQDPRTIEGEYRREDDR